MLVRGSMHCVISFLDVSGQDLEFSSDTNLLILTKYGSRQEVHRRARLIWWLVGNLPDRQPQTLNGHGGLDLAVTAASW